LGEVFIYLTLVLPPGAVPTGAVEENPGIMPLSMLCEAVVPPPSVGWRSVLFVAEAVLGVVISLLRVVVTCEAVVGVVIGAVVPLFLSLPQAQSAKTSASAKNIARIFFITFSL
jgi:hypothetical protein